MLDEEKLKAALVRLAWHPKDSRHPVVLLSTVQNLLKECTIPIQPPVEDPKRSRRARIEAAIRHFYGATAKLSTEELLDLCRYFLGQPQPTWEDKDLGLEEEK